MIMNFDKFLLGGIAELWLSVAYGSVDLFSMRELRRDDIDLFSSLIWFDCKSASIGNAALSLSAICDVSASISSFTCSSLLMLSAFLYSSITLFSLFHKPADGNLHGKEQQTFLLEMILFWQHGKRN